MIPQVIDDDGARLPNLVETAQLRDGSTREVGDRPFDIVIEGAMADHSPAAFADAGATWWIESMWDAMNEHSPVTAAHDRLRPARPALRTTGEPRHVTVHPTAGA